MRHASAAIVAAFTFSVVASAPAVAAKTAQAPHSASPASGIIQPETTSIRWPDAALATRNPRERYRIVEDCMTFRRFDRLFKAEASNPDYPLNSPRALARLPPAERRLLAGRVRLVKEKRSDCATWAASVDNATAGKIYYQAALDAAAAGDVRAGTCYAMGHTEWPDGSRWPPPDGLHPEGASFAASHRARAPQLLMKAISAGYWPAVVTADNVGRSDHGRQAAIMAYSPRQRYVFKRLLQRGVGDPDLADAYRAEADRLAPALTALERDKADAQAEMQFAKVFHGTPMTESERYENCGN